MNMANHGDLLGQPRSAGEFSDLLRLPLPLRHARHSQCPGLAILLQARGSLSAGRWHVKVRYSFFF